MQALNLQLRGLYTHPNSLSEVPPGALLKAKNTVMDKEGILEIRRGLMRYGNELTLGSGKIENLFNFKNTLLVSYNSKLAYDSDGLGNWSDYSGSFSPPSGVAKIRNLEASKNFFFTTSAGIKKIDSVTGTPSNAGGIKALDGSAALSAAGSGFFTKNNQLAYRIVWGIKDANDNLILGSPSQRINITNPNTGAADTVSLTFTVPSGITVLHFYQVYRSVLSGGESIVANDELGLVYEDNPTAGEIAAKSITITDVTPETLRGATLYTSPSQQGILQSNDPPPLAKDIAFYKNATLYANTLNKQRLIITLMGVGAPGFVIDDTIKIDTITYTGKAVENIGAAQFKVTTNLTPAENIDLTAQSLVKVINQHSSNTVYYAYYLSGYNDLPGKILIEERVIGGASFAFNSSNGSAFNPVLPVSGTSVSTTNEAYKNRIYVSKLFQPEAVPIANTFDIGSADKAIIRVIALRDSFFVFKEDGLFRVTGTSLLNYDVSLFDITVILNASETAVAFDNQIYAYTSQGVVGISDTGVSIKSRSIEVDLLQTSTYTNFNSLSFGVAYNSDRKFIFFTQKKSTDTYPKQAFVYNSIVREWTRWEKNFNCGIVNSSDNKLYFGAADSGYVYVERKSFLDSDYSDEEFSVSLNASSGTKTLTMTSTSGIVAGNILYQNSKKTKISSITNATTIEVEDILTWESNPATIYTAIPVEIETVQQHCQNPGILKHFRDIDIFFRRINFIDLGIGIRSDFSPTLDVTNLIPINPILWGKAPWGSFGWPGNESADYQVVRTFIPRNKQRAHWILVNVSHSNARDYFAVAGISFNFQQMSERFK